MSLYDDVIDTAGGKKDWNSPGMKLLQSQIARQKKAHATGVQREKSRPGAGPPPAGPAKGQTGPAPESLQSVTVGGVIADTKKVLAAVPQPSLLKPRKALVLVDGPPLSFIPKAAREENMIIFGEVEVKDEYNPMIPNVFEKVRLKRAEKWRLEKAEQKRVEIEQQLLRHKDEMVHQEIIEEEQELKKRRIGAAIAPPPTLVEAPPPEVSEPTPSATAEPGVTKGLGVAARIMERMGYKEGGGLGARGQGISTALQVQKIGENQGIIVDQHQLQMKAKQLQQQMQQQQQIPHSLVPAYEGADDDAPSGPGAEPTPPLDEVQEVIPGSVDLVPINELLKNKTKVVMLRNMINPDEVDEELEPEVREEMMKYGAVVKVTIYKMPDHLPPTELVRIFVEFVTIDQAIKAVVAMNGRWFGGRQIKAAFYEFEKFQQMNLTENVV